MKHVTLVVGIGLLLCMSGLGKVRDTRHNLSASGPGQVRTADTTQMCIFCHTSHSSAAATPLWNKDAGPRIYQTYASSTLRSVPGQPDGNSKLCLSCHDGTVAVGKVRNPNQTFAMAGTIGGLMSGDSNLGTDLSDDHPVSFHPLPASGLVDPPVPDVVHYDAAGKLQCTTCHDAHEDTNGRFLVRTDLNGALCKTCHQQDGFSGSTHDISPATWNGTGPDPWPSTDYTTVSDNACANCHRGHNAGIHERLLSQNNEDQVCRVCHNGNVAGLNVVGELSKTSAHQTGSYNQIHDPTENPDTMARHVECVDCHNPHATTADPAVAPFVPGPLRGVSGAEISGNPVEESIYEYQICIKCHGDNVSFHVNPFANRELDTSNIRLAVNPDNPSYHPVAAAGRSASVPSLLPPYTELSQIYCTDCHNSDSSVNAGGSGPNGPHGSIYPFILERRYETTDYTSYSTAAYALCFKCHDPNVLMSGTSTFRGLHRRHVIRESMPCSICHDPHGVPQGLPEDGDHAGLINFDLNVVQPDTGGRLRFEVDATRGTCYMSCHGTEHSPKFYGR